MNELLTEIGLLSRRSVRRTLRQPALIVPTIVFPLFLLAVNASGLDSATKIPGFPTASYLDFAITVPFMQGALFASTTAGTEIANDIETGFLNRLQLTPLRGAAILIGQMAGAVLLALIGAVIYLAVGLLAGVTIAAGVGGALLLLVLAVIVAIAFASIGALLATRTGSSQAVQGMFPLIFVLFFLSSMSMPRNLIGVDWFRTVATWNPISYLVEGLRSLVITGWDGPALAKGFGAALAITVLAGAAASASLRTRMART
ncbi:MAG TPA: ABC transporter permease [Baekduia sp.]|uniref:ABC transporter permease n=1 Tax=Baekduia sp. TaxID=2600305 RepID=UPI002BC4F61D|nr:ABC transporter permease [Baekduia sp.]HMJ34123.1 ABC transporter permease [Baekduia sp.]